MPPIVTSAEIERPAAEVYAYATDPARFSEWQKGVVDGHLDGLGDGTQAPAPHARLSQPVTHQPQVQVPSGVLLLPAPPNTTTLPVAPS